MADSPISKWYVELRGENIDLDDWVYTLNEPFDPVAFKHPEWGYVLSSSEFTLSASASEIREKAKALINRLNGTMAVMHRCKPVSGGGIRELREDGISNVTVFAEMVAISFGRAVARGTATVIRPDGLPGPPPPPQPSMAQSWNLLATFDNNVADLLEQHGKADGWYEIYKTLELAECIVGGERRLKRLLGASGQAYANMRRTANFYRHARAARPVTMPTIHEAIKLLHFIVRTVLDQKLAQGKIPQFPPPLGRRDIS